MIRSKPTYRAKPPLAPVDFRNTVKTLPDTKVLRGTEKGGARVKTFSLQLPIAASNANFGKAREQ